MSDLNSPTFREIYESQNENQSISSVAIRINCENHSIDNSTNLTSDIQCPLPSSSSVQSTSSFENNNHHNNQNKPLIHKPQLNANNNANNNNNLNNNALDDDIIELPDLEYPIIEPIVIRGDGSITLFGLSNMFCTDFPSLLIGRIAKEEFQSTITKINTLLREHHNTNLKLMLFGCLCCCCSLGCSLLWPTLALSKRTRSSLEKLLAEENNRLYNKLGFNWKLSKETSHNNSAFMEYVILIEFSPKLQIYQPD